MEKMEIMARRGPTTPPTTPPAIARVRLLLWGVDVVIVSLLVLLGGGGEAEAEG